jgi:hypothetical protein
LLKTVLADPTPAAGLTFYRALNRLLAHTLDHFANEEPAVMDLLWALCTDDELAACRAALRADISSQEAAWTFELVLQSSTADEQGPVGQGLRANMPEPVFAAWLTGVEQTLPADALGALRRLVEQTSTVGLTEPPSMPRKGW